MSDTQWREDCEVGIYPPNGGGSASTVASVVLYDQGVGYVDKTQAIELAKTLLDYADVEYEVKE